MRGLLVPHGGLACAQLLMTDLRHRIPTGTRVQRDEAELRPARWVRPCCRSRSPAWCRSESRDRCSAKCCADSRCRQCCPRRRWGAEPGSTHPVKSTSWGPPALSVTISAEVGGHREASAGAGRRRRRSTTSGGLNGRPGLTLLYSGLEGVVQRPGRCPGVVSSCPSTCRESPTASCSHSRWPPRRAR